MRFCIKRLSPSVVCIFDTFNTFTETFTHLLKLCHILLKKRTLLWLGRPRRVGEEEKKCRAKRRKGMVGEEEEEEGGGRGGT